MLGSMVSVHSGDGLVMANSFAIPWTVAWQVPLSMGFFRQEYWNGLPFPSPGDLPNPEIKPSFPHCRQILHQLSHQRSPTIYIFTFIKNCQMLKSLYYFHCPCQQMKAPTAPWSHQHFSPFFKKTTLVVYFVCMKVYYGKTSTSASTSWRQDNC